MSFVNRCPRGDARRSWVAETIPFVSLHSQPLVEIHFSLSRASIAVIGYHNPITAQTGWEAARG